MEGEAKENDLRPGFYLGIEIWGGIRKCWGVYFSGRRTSAEGASASAKGAKPPTIRGSGERRKLLQRGLGRSPSRQRFWERLAYKMGLFLL